MFDVDDIINKSLDQVEEMVRKSEELVKSDVPPHEVSNDTPQDNPEEGAPEGDTPVEGEEPPVEEGAPEEDGQPPVDNEEVPPEEDNIDKSLVGDLAQSDNVRKALEVSDFLQDLVKGISSVILENTANINKSVQTGEKSTEFLAKSFEGIAKSQQAIVNTQAELIKSVRELSQKVHTLETTPIVRKSMATNAQVIEKSFAGQPVNPGNKLSKSEAVGRLTAEYQNRPEFMNDILALEATGDLNSLSANAKQFLNI